MRPVQAVAPELLGKLLVHRTPEGITAGRIVEVEAYAGPEDKGAHSYGGKRTPRTEIQFGPGGFAYIYFIYGMHCCFNVVTNGPGVPQVALIRALEPVEGIELMMRRRGLEDKTALCNGPGKLCQAMGITKAQYGADLCGPDLYLVPGPEPGKGTVMASPRVNIDYAQEFREVPWRYYIKDDPFVSKVPKRYGGQVYR